MPKAAVNKDDLSGGGKNQVRFSGQVQAQGRLSTLRPPVKDAGNMRAGRDDKHDKA